MTRVVRSTLVSLVAVGLMISAPSQASEPYQLTITRSYVGGEAGPLIGSGYCGGSSRNGTFNVGAVCFGGTPSELLSLTIKDDSGLPVGGVAQVTDRKANTLAYWTFCGSSEPVRVPSGILNVFLDAPGDVYPLHWYNGPGCRNIHGPFGVGTSTGATTGRVHATFYFD